MRFWVNTDVIDQTNWKVSPNNTSIRQDFYPMKQIFSLTKVPRFRPLSLKRKFLLILVLTSA
jgi:hypothetical protein